MMHRGCFFRTIPFDRITHDSDCLYPESLVKPCRVPALLISSRLHESHVSAGRIEAQRGSSFPSHSGQGPSVWAMRRR